MRLKKGWKLTIALLAVLVLLLGLRTMFAPSDGAFGVELEGVTGLNSMRSMFPGVLLGSALMMAVGLWKNDTTWVLATAPLMGVPAQPLLEPAFAGSSHFVRDSAVLGIACGDVARAPPAKGAFRIVPNRVRRPSTPRRGGLRGESKLARRETCYAAS